ncbi:unnamed protein product [Miscanthus lutarioriparius]|uniref:Double-strand break repair protein n=1 Tax=Miscanthus lutarioriparius TaxID=422564 RepID=A0A811QTY5_9POAL|nr:unnamed protein product [Miscanthus lutarioriparius]
MSEPAQPRGGEGDSNTLRILVATDCHLGYMEKDEIRRFDSFQAFEEICALADQNKFWRAHSLFNMRECIAGHDLVALYGLGNIRDERLNRMFQTPHSVQWMRPGTQDGESVSDWFNILVLHQNRIKTNPKSAINEHFLPRFLDFVVWGHEHECLIDPQEVPGMGFHITQPGSSVATSLIDGEAKPKHVVLKDEADVDPNDQASVLEHLDKIVRNLIEKSSQPTASRSEPKLPLVRIKVDYSGFSTINPQRFGQKYVGKVANPQDILIFSKSAKKRQTTGDHIDDSEKLRPEELNQQTIEALVAESNLKMEILPVDDLDIALHDFVNKDDKMAFYSCLQRNLEETRNKLSSEADKSKIEEEDIIVKVNECMQERVKERSLRSKDGTRFPSSSQNLDTGGKSFTAQSSLNSFSDDEDTRDTLLGARSTDVGRKSSGFTRPSKDTADVAKHGASKRGRGRGTSSMKQTTLSFSQSRSTTVIRSEDVSSEEEADANEVVENSEEESAQQVGRKRTAPRGRGRGRGSTAKRGRKTDIASIQSMMSKDDDDSEDEPPKKAPPRVTRNYGAVRKR